MIGILPKRNLNNGQPSLHAALIAAAAPQPREHVLHIGVGVGYYTAILAELVGATGRVTAIEFDAELAARATANLAQHVRAVHGDGTRIAFAPADVIYVNAGATRPADAMPTSPRSPLSFEARSAPRSYPTVSARRRYGATTPNSWH